ncbi:MAG: hypothetical protein P0Y66_14905 [Candidatus Kaistia colombiensis]|nr:MAG: hypothetical protein P0Y66_14905 [Kaistia sp.]
MSTPFIPARLSSKGKRRTVQLDHMGVNFGRRYPRIWGQLCTPNDILEDDGPVREIFRQACQAAEIRYFHPHLFRKTLARLGEKMCRTPEEFKAWSQNLGHNKVSTTFEHYGQVDTDRQHELIQALASRNGPSEREQELIARYRAASPEIQNAIMTLVAR